MLLVGTVFVWVGAAGVYCSSAFWPGRRVYPALRHTSSVNKVKAAGHK